MKKLSLIKLALCGPADVAKELDIAGNVIEDWNRLHGEVRSVSVQQMHWTKDSFPDAEKTGQGAVNEQMIDQAHILVVVFWSRLGTPTKNALSGTVEEIKRGVAHGKKVLVYFSDLEPIPRDAHQEQVDLLWKFRQELRSASSCSNFSSRSQFKDQFTTHLALAVNILAPPPKPKRAKKFAPTINQNAGAGSVLNAGDGNVITQNHYHKPPVFKTVIERPAGCVSSEQLVQVSKWIEELAEGTLGTERSKAYSDWGGFLKRRFVVERRELLPASKMPEVEAWYREQRAMQKSGYKTKAPDHYRASRMTAIKSAMKGMGKTNDSYYPEIEIRLKMKKPFTSLKNLTKIDLDRVYRLVLSDARSLK